jgi:hypothetical protein
MSAVPAIKLPNGLWMIGPMFCRWCNTSGEGAAYVCDLLHKHPTEKAATACMRKREKGKGNAGERAKADNGSSASDNPRVAR